MRGRQGIASQGIDRPSCVGINRESMRKNAACEIDVEPSMASALRRLEAYSKKIPMQVNPAAAQLAIVNPLAGVRGGAFIGLFRTHPPTEERIARLMAL